MREGGREREKEKVNESSGVLSWHACWTYTAHTVLTGQTDREAGGLRALLCAALYLAPRTGNEHTLRLSGRNTRCGAGQPSTHAPVCPGNTPEPPHTHPLFSAR